MSYFTLQGKAGTPSMYRLSLRNIISKALGTHPHFLCETAVNPQGKVTSWNILKKQVFLPIFRCLDKIQHFPQSIHTIQNDLNSNSFINRTENNFLISIKKGKAFLSKLRHSFSRSIIRYVFPWWKATCSLLKYSL